jgi:site-specific DNA-cytosine methylase
VKATIPFVDMFVGLGSASHYLKEWFHPVAAFDSDSDARKVFKKFFPEAVVTADFNNMLVEGDGEGTYKQAAKTARVAFCSPPCSSISVMNDARDESSAQARLVVDTVRLLQDGVLEVMVIESTPNLVAALGGKLYAEMHTAPDFEKGTT